MPLEPHRFRRLVLGLQPSAPPDTMRLAVDLAELLQLDLLGLFLEDTSLHDLAGMPFAREIRTLGGGWHPIDLDRLSRDVALSARSIERMFTDAAKRLATRHQFEVTRGPMTETIASISRTDDILVIVEPLRAAERASQQFNWLLQGAFRSAAAVMLVPPRIARTKGPVAAIAATADDPAIRAAAAIAIAAKEDLIIVDICEVPIDEARIRALAAELGLAVKHLVAGQTLRLHPAAYWQASPLQERLVVMTRGVLKDAEASTMASARGVPVLVVEPPEIPPNAPVAS